MRTRNVNFVVDTRAERERWEIDGYRERERSLSPWVPSLTSSGMNQLQSEENDLIYLIIRREKDLVSLSDICRHVSFFFYLCETLQ